MQRRRFRQKGAAVVQVRGGSLKVEAAGFELQDDSPCAGGIGAAEECREDVWEHDHA